MCKSDSELFLRLWWWKGRGSPQTASGNKQLILILQAVLGFAMVVRGNMEGMLVPPVRKQSWPHHTAHPQVPPSCSSVPGGNMEWVPQQHLQPEHKHWHWAREKKSGGSSGLAQPGEDTVLLRAWEGSQVQGSSGILHRHNQDLISSGRATLILLHAHARRLLLFAFSLSLPFQVADWFHVPKSS